MVYPMFFVKLRMKIIFSKLKLVHEIRVVIGLTIHFNHHQGGKVLSELKIVLINMVSPTLKNKSIQDITIHYYFLKFLDV